MNYELAKELKDAGFLQTGDYGYRDVGAVDVHGKMQFRLLNYHRDIPELTDVRIPTLEELLEACKPDLYTLENDHRGWHAHCRAYNDYFTGTTPTEAVARLWLALHEPRNQNNNQ